MGPQTNNSVIQRLQDLPIVLKTLVRDPVGLMKMPMRLSWPAAVSLQVGLAMVSGALVGAANRSIWDFIAGVFLFPISSIAVGFVLSGFFYFTFSVFFKTLLDYRRLHSVVVVATSPYFIIHSLAGFVAPIDLIGFALTAVLLVVGLSEQFDLPKKTIMRLIGCLYLVFFVAWVIAQIQIARQEPARLPSSAETQVTPNAAPVGTEAQPRR